MLALVWHVSRRRRANRWSIDSCIIVSVRGRSACGCCIRLLLLALVRLLTVGTSLCTIVTVVVPLIVVAVGLIVLVGHGNGALGGLLRESPSSSTSRHHGEDDDQEDDSNSDGNADTGSCAVPEATVPAWVVTSVSVAVVWHFD